MRRKTWFWQWVVALEVAALASALPAAAGVALRHSLTLRPANVEPRGRVLISVRAPGVQAVSIRLLGAAPRLDRWLALRSRAAGS